MFNRASKLTALVVLVLMMVLPIFGRPSATATTGSILVYVLASMVSGVLLEHLQLSLVVFVPCLRL